MKEVLLSVAYLFEGCFNFFNTAFFFLCEECEILVKEDLMFFGKVSEKFDFELGLNQFN